MTFEWLGAAADEKNACIVDDDGADADQGRQWKLAFNASRHCEGLPEAHFKGNSQTGG
jgi:hypothetical protein